MMSYLYEVDRLTEVSLLVTRQCKCEHVSRTLE